ncbi:hypothetical protein PC112_g15952 [Phytophthora cactorum]|nr:hypothetical protein PC112_g15952 [Phytophthora cactorum]
MFGQPAVLQRLTCCCGVKKTLTFSKSPFTTITKITKLESCPSSAYRGIVHSCKTPKWKPSTCYEKDWSLKKKGFFVIFGSIPPTRGQRCRTEFPKHSIGSVRRTDSQLHTWILTVKKGSTLLDVLPSRHRTCGPSSPYLWRGSFCERYTRYQLFPVQDIMVATTTCSMLY